MASRPPQPRFVAAPSCAVMGRSAYSGASSSCRLRAGDDWRSVIEYRLSYRGDAPRPNAVPDEAARLQLAVTCADSHGLVAAVVTGSTAHSGSVREGNWRAAALLEAVQEVERRIDSGLLSPESGLGLELVFDGQGAVVQLAQHLQQRKRCLWHRRMEPRGLLCAATGQKEAEPTSDPRCARCAMPDARLLCSAFTHPQMGGATIGQIQRGIYPVSGPDGDDMYSAMCCDDGHEPSCWSECSPTSRDQCWHRVVSTGQPAPAPNSESPRRAVDEIGYFRLAYADRFELSRSKARSFWPKSDESAVNSLRDDCNTFPQFRAHVVALCEMLLSMKPHGQLSDDRGEGSDGRPVNGVTALGRVMEDRFGDPSHAGMISLSALVTARNGFSHPGQRGLASAMRALGVEQYPPQSYRLAWWQVAASVAEGLARTRSTLQNVTPTPLC